MMMKECFRTGATAVLAGILAAGPAAAGGKPVPVDVAAGGEKSLAMPFAIGADCKVRAPKFCTDPKTPLGTLTVELKTWNVADAAAHGGRAHCLPAAGGKLDGTMIYVATFQARPASLGNAYGYDQVTVTCVMPDRSVQQRYLKIKVLPKDD